MIQHFLFGSGGWRAENVLRALLIVCALLLVLVSLNGRTVWTKGPAPNPAAPTIRDAAGWDWVARVSGVLAISSIGLGWRWRHRPGVAVAAAAAATVAFGWSAVVAWRYWQDLADGAGQRDGWTMSPPVNIPFAALIAGTAASVAVVLTIRTLPSTPRLR